MVEKARESNRLERISLQGIKIDCIRSRELYSVVKRLLSDKKKHYITYVNIHTMNIAYHDARLRETYNRSTITYCDGAGVVIGARLLGKYLPEHMTAATFLPELCRHWQDDGTSLYFLGGLPGVAAKACERLEALYPRLKISGHAHGYFLRGSKEEDEILSKISETHPDILFIGFGTPLQEYWAMENWTRLEARVVWSIGAIVDYLSGTVPRCPKWMERYYLEWLFRFLIEPRRMFSRYVIGNPLFFLRIVKERLSKS